LFADDLKLFIEIRCENNCRKLQSDLNVIDAWANNIGLEFNIRTYILQQNVPIVFKYTLYDFLLTNAGNMVNDLGVTLDRELTFHDHIEKSFCETLKTLGFI